MSALVAFVALIAILMLVKRTGRNTYIGYRGSALRNPFGSTRDSRLTYINSRRGLRPLRPVPSRALIGTGQWHRRWDQMSGSSTYSRDAIRGSGAGRPMLHMA